MSETMSCPSNFPSCHSPLLPLSPPTVWGSSQQTYFSSSNPLDSFPPQGLGRYCSFSLMWPFFPPPPFWLFTGLPASHLWALSLNIIPSENYLTTSPVRSEGNCSRELSSGPRRRLRLTWAGTIKVVLSFNVKFSTAWMGTGGIVKYCGLQRSSFQSVQRWDQCEVL